MIWLGEAHNGTVFDIETLQYTSTYTKLHLMARLQLWSFGECEVPIRGYHIRSTLTQSGRI